MCSTKKLKEHSKKMERSVKEIEQEKSEMFIEQLKSKNEKEKTS